MPRPNESSDGRCDTPAGAKASLLPTPRALRRMESKLFRSDRQAVQRTQPPRGTARTNVSGADGCGDVAQAPPEPALGEVVKVEVRIELGRTFVDSVNDNRAGTELVASPHAPPESVDEQVATQSLSLFGPVDSKSGQVSRYSPERTGAHPEGTGLAPLRSARWWALYPQANRAQRQTARTPLRSPLCDRLAPGPPRPVRPQPSVRSRSAFRR